MSTGTPPLSGPPQPPPKPQAKALNCPNCGAAITLRSFQQAVTVVCESCHSILDAKDPNLRILQQFKGITDTDKPLIPLGTRGKLRGTDYEVIGFQRRTITSEGVRYSWHEYLLFNPYKGFRYLTEYQGHWNDISVCKTLPVVQSGVQPRAEYLGDTYKHFQTAEAVTTFVLGEFPWQVRVNERAEVTEFVCPPHVLSCEKTGAETSWSIGEYLYGSEVWKSFTLPGSPPEAIGVYENQPSPVTSDAKNTWMAFAIFGILLLGLIVFFDIYSAKAPVFQSAYLFRSGESKTESSFVTDIFELKGRLSNVEVSTHADVSNNWIYLNYALINQDTGQAWDFGREVSYYYGRDSDGSWSEGSDHDSVVVPSVPAGHYYLRIEPESDPKHPPVGYTVEVKRGVPVLGFFGIAFLALLIPAIVITWRSISFERACWSESDHPPIQIGNSEE